MVPSTIQHLQSPTLNLLLVMVLIWTAGVIFRKIKQPPLLGELLAGIVFGPSLFGILQYDATLEVLSELGVFFLMFYAGIETNPFDLKRMGKLSSIVGFGGFFVPFIMGYGTCILFFNLNNIQSLFIGLGLSITAIAVNARVLNDLSLQKFRVTPVIMGAAIIDDILSLALLSTIIGLAVNNYIFDWQTLILVPLKVFLFFGISIFLGMKLYPKISKYFTHKEAKGFTFSLIVALIFGFMAELAGLHIILGAYMAGLFVREEIVNRALLYKINQRFVSITYGFL
ncbi:cation:proton antiporter [candidate division KSB1 bacterium]|nr:cation:proton antiporter [candidate division KSB1 bacterium]